MPGKMIIEGYALTFEQPATHEYPSGKGNTCIFTEILKRGSLDNCEMVNVPLRYNHNDTWCIIASTRNNSLRLTVDNYGLKIRAELADTQANRDIYEVIKTGLIDKMSFAFSIHPDGEEWKKGSRSGEVIREVTSMKKLYDVSVVDTPFYESTSIHIVKEEPLELRKMKMKMKYKYMEV